MVLFPFLDIFPLMLVLIGIFLPLWRHTTLLLLMMVIIQSLLRLLLLLHL